MVLNWLLTQGIAHPTGSWHRCGLWPLKRKLEVEGKAAWTICQTELQILSATYPPKKKKKWPRSSSIRFLMATVQVLSI